MAVSRGFQDFILDLLGPLDPMPRRMFSGVGLFHGGVMFGLLAREAMYLRVDDMTRERFERAGSRPFSYQRGERRGQSVGVLRGAGGSAGSAGRAAAMDARCHRNCSASSFECATCQVSFRCSAVSKKADRG